MAEAARFAKKGYPDFKMDEALFPDAAILHRAGSLKAPGSPVAGKGKGSAFPDLGVGNTGCTGTD